MRMALLVLILIGSLLGWIATIITRTEDRRGILSHVGIGVAGALVIGVLSNSGSIIGGLSAIAFLAAMVGAGTMLAGYSYWHRRQLSE